MQSSYRTPHTSHSFNNLFHPSFSFSSSLHLQLFFHLHALLVHSFLHSSQRATSIPIPFSSTYRRARRLTGVRGPNTAAVASGQPKGVDTNLHNRIRAPTPEWNAVEHSIRGTSCTSRVWYSFPILHSVSHCNVNNTSLAILSASLSYRIASHL